MTLLSFLRTQIAQIKVTLLIMSFEHGMHERNGIGSLTLVICGALKERYLKGQSVRAVIWIVIVY